jgi:hypothetical protein
VRVQGRDVNAPASVPFELAGAHVVVRGNGRQWSGTTNGQGLWTSEPLPPGTYDIEVTAPTAVRAASARVTIGNKNVTQPFMLKLRVPQ